MATEQQELKFKQITEINKDKLEDPFRIFVNCLFSTQNTFVHEECFYLVMENEIMEIKEKCSKAFYSGNEIKIHKNGEVKIFDSKDGFKLLPGKKIEDSSEVKEDWVAWFKVDDGILGITKEKIHFHNKVYDNDIHEDNCKYFLGFQDGVAILGNNRSFDFKYFEDTEMVEADEMHPICCRTDKETFQPIFLEDLKFYNNQIVTVDEECVTIYELEGLKKIEKQREVVEYRIEDNKLIRVDKTAEGSNATKEIDRTTSNATKEVDRTTSNATKDVDKITSLFEDTEKSNATKEADRTNSSFEDTEKSNADRTTSLFEAKEKSNATKETASLFGNTNSFTRSRDSLIKEKNKDDNGISSKSSFGFGAETKNGEEENKSDFSLKDISKEDSQISLARKLSHFGFDSFNEELKKETNSSDIWKSLMNAPKSATFKDNSQRTPSPTSVTAKETIAAKDNSQRTPSATAKETDGKSITMEFKSHPAAKNNNPNPQTPKLTKEQTQTVERISRNFTMRIEKLKRDFKLLSKETSSLPTLLFNPSRLEVDELYNLVFHNKVEEYERTLSSMIHKLETLKFLDTSNLKETVKFFDSKIQERKHIKREVVYNEPLIPQPNKVSVESPVSNFIQQFKVLKITDDKKVDVEFTRAAAPVASVAQAVSPPTFSSKPAIPMPTQSPPSSIAFGYGPQSTIPANGNLGLGSSIPSVGAPQVQAPQIDPQAKPSAFNRFAGSRNLFN